jgi:hypothetical protein
MKRGRFHNTENLITGAGPIPQVADRPRKDARPSEVTRKVLLINLADNEADTSDWRTPITNYLRNPNIRTDKNIQRIAIKYVLMSDELYRRTVNDVLLKCLGPDVAILAMAEVHECDGTSQVIRPTYSCPLSNGPQTTLQVPLNHLTSSVSAFLPFLRAFYPSRRHYNASEVRKCGSSYNNLLYLKQERVLLQTRV